MPACPDTSVPATLDVTRYDCSPALSPEERAALSLRRLGRWNYKRAALQRLEEPLNAIMRAFGTNRRRQLYVWAALARGMEVRGTSYWAWSVEDWLAVIAEAPQGNRDHGVGLRLIALAYLCGITDLRLLLLVRSPQDFALHMLGSDAVAASTQGVCADVLRWGYATRGGVRKHLPPTIALALLMARTPRVEALTDEILAVLERHVRSCDGRRMMVTLLWRVLTHRGITKRHVSGNRAPSGHKSDLTVDIAPNWVMWCQRWERTTTMATARQVFYHLLKIGRWLAAAHPEVTDPADWTPELAAEFIAALAGWTCEQYISGLKPYRGPAGKPLSASTKLAMVLALRTFFCDLQEWGLLTPRLNPARHLASPRAWLALVGPNPRPLDEVPWAKIVWAAIHLQAEDVPRRGRELTEATVYPPAMVQALAAVTVLGGLRANEIIRLRVGCISWPYAGHPEPGLDEPIPEKAVCQLTVPVQKTGTAFAKPVQGLVGQRVAAWERERPAQPRLRDRKTGEMVDFLFCYRGQRVSRVYINNHLIPLICRKAGVPEETITNHRFRHSMISNLVNAENPMSNIDVSAWAGHKSLDMIRYYAKPVKLSKSFANADTLGRAVATMNVLLDQEAIKSGAAAQGQPYMYYDLGPGWCSHQFFDTCEYRMVCPGCPLFIPKESMRGQLLERKQNVLRLQQEVPLTPEEAEAVEHDTIITDKLLAKLGDRPTPSGQRPSELAQRFTPQHPLPMAPSKPAGRSKRSTAS